MTDTTCAFCGGPGPLTLEHAWPDWALAYVRGDSMGPHRITSRYGDVFRQWQGAAPEITVKILCEACNGKRLGPIEAEIAPILKPLVAGKERLVLRPDVELISLWAVKTAMVFEFTFDHQPFYSLDERRKVALDRSTPSRTSVLVARYTANQNWLFEQGREITLTPLDGGPAYAANLSTVSIGQFAAQVITHRAPHRETAQMLLHPHHTVKQIWPNPPNLIWPPRGYLTDESLAVFANGGIDPATGETAASVEFP